MRGTGRCGRTGPRDRLGGPSRYFAKPAQAVTANCGQIRPAAGDLPRTFSEGVEPRRDSPDRDGSTSARLQICSTGRCGGAPAGARIPASGTPSPPRSTRRRPARRCRGGTSRVNEKCGRRKDRFRRRRALARWSPRRGRQDRARFGASRKTVPDPDSGPPCAGPAARGLQAPDAEGVARAAHGTRQAQAVTLRARPLVT